MILFHRAARLFLATLVGVAVGCGGDSTGPDEPDPVTIASVTITPQPPTLVPGQSIQLEANVLDSNASPIVGAAVAWTSDAPSVARVDALGLVSALAVGEATITATAGSVGGQARVTVEPSPWEVIPQPLGPGTARAEVTATGGFAVLRVFCDASTANFRWGLSIRNLGEVTFAEGVTLRLVPTLPDDPEPTWSAGSGTLSLSPFSDEPAVMQSLMRSRNTAILTYPLGSNATLTMATFDVRGADAAFSEAEAICRGS